jgi:hypothetical protein
VVWSHAARTPTSIRPSAVIMHTFSIGKLAKFVQGGEECHSLCRKLFRVDMVAHDGWLRSQSPQLAMRQSSSRICTWAECDYVLSTFVGRARSFSPTAAPVAALYHVTKVRTRLTLTRRFSIEHD